MKKLGELTNNGEFSLWACPIKASRKKFRNKQYSTKTCSYSCVYCQLGRINHMLFNRQVFYKPEDILIQVKRKINKATLRGEKIDYLTFVPDGEPTLDINMGKEISLLKQMGIPIAVITNASLLWQERVRKDLMEADFISLKVDAVNQDFWKSINRPHKSLRLNII